MRCHLKMICLMAATASMCYLVTSVTWLQLLLLFLGASSVLCILFLLSDSERAHAFFKRPRSLRSNWDDVTRVYGLDDHYCPAEAGMNNSFQGTNYSQGNREPNHSHTQVFPAAARVPAVPSKSISSQRKSLSPAPVATGTPQTASERRDSAAFRMREWAKTR